MNESFRRRVFTPILMPVTILGGILLFAWSLSRILLAVPKSISVLVAVVAAAYVLVVAFVVERSRNISAPALAVGLTIAMLGLVGAGGVAASVGVREIEEHGGEGEEGGDAAVTEIPEGALVWGADSSLVYTSAPAEAPAGEVTVAIDNSSGQVHNVVIEGFQGDSVLVEATNGIDVTTITIDPGTYTYFCSIAGHRAAGMEGDITFS
ncbi:cupredoxin domain-containing protein [Euzebya tangerina]|uniref:cupredoxin domain-containing protein n=1 Tax=Euzebya tangerina TaxID=591198 RepID=UPI0013C336C0|nr:plastocyanin/azurin family copper-binding protein [Euzebya tangerina]